MSRGGPERSRFQLLNQKTQFVRLERRQQHGTCADRHRAVQRIQAVEMGKRGRAEHAVLRRDAVFRGSKTGVAEHRAVRMRHALGRCGGARGIEQQECIARIGLRVCLFKRSCLLKFRNQVGRIEKQLRPAMAQDGVDLRAAVRHVQRAHHRAEAAGGKVGDQELRGVRELHRDHVAGADAAPPEALGRFQDALLQALPGNSRRGSDNRRRVRPLAGMAREPRGQRVVRPPAARNEHALARRIVGRSFHPGVY
jgi:hypothetical protein